MATLSDENMDALHQIISDVIPDNATFYCVVFTPDDQGINVLNNAHETEASPRRLREMVRELVEQELTDRRVVPDAILEQ